MMEEMGEDQVATVGQRLRDAREAKGLSVEDIAASTRIPTRHLSALESGEWDKLPAPTYSVGFAKSYAAAVGLDRNEIGESLRIEMGGVRQAAPYVEVFEAADPARAMPKGLVLSALIVLALVVAGLVWMRNRSLQADPVAEAEVNEAIANVAAPPPSPAQIGPVVLTATDAVWIEIRDGQTILKQGEMIAGERFEVPLNAVAPVLTTGKPEALRISVGTTTAGAIGPEGTRVTGVSLKGEDLLKAPAATTAAPDPLPAAAPPAATAPSSRPAPPTSRPATSAPAPAAPPATVTESPATATTNSAAPNE